MALRIVFSRDDLTRLRIRDAADPMWELVQSLHHIQEDRAAEPYQDWRRQARRRLAAHARSRELLGRLITLVPSRGAFPDFLTPVHPHRDIDAGCEQVACTDRETLAPDLGRAFAGRPAPPWVRNLAAGDRSDLTAVVAALRVSFDILLRPHWPDIRALVAEDRASSLRTLSSGGIRALFAHLPGVLGWDGEVLRVRYPWDRTLRLEGRGLTLVPSRFCWTNPITLIDPDLSPVLVHPVHPAATLASRAADPRHLATLLGENRANCLRTLTTPHTTSALADRVGVSVSSASKQATALRKAGLVISERDSNAVIHRLSPLGAALLSGSLPAI